MSGTSVGCSCTTRMRRGSAWTGGGSSCSASAPCRYVADVGAPARRGGGEDRPRDDYNSTSLVTPIRVPLKQPAMVCVIKVLLLLHLPKVTMAYQLVAIRFSITDPACRLGCCASGLHPQFRRGRPPRQHHHARGAGGSAGHVEAYGLGRGAHTQSTYTDSTALIGSGNRQRYGSALGGKWYHVIVRRGTSAFSLLVPALFLVWPCLSPAMHAQAVWRQDHHTGANRRD